VIEGLPALLLIVLLVLATLAIVAASLAGFAAIIFLELRETILGVQHLSRWAKQRRRPAATFPQPPYGTDFSSRP